MSVDRTRAEEVIQQLLIQLEELREAIRVVQTRSLALSSELQEIRIAYDTLGEIQKLSQQDVFASLDRNGYVFVKAKLLSVDEAIVRLGKEYYISLPIDKAKNVLMEYEKELTEELRETETELRKLTELYNQIQKKIQEYVAMLQKSSISEKRS
ncbi:prefoldin subunit alpha [Ignisphaera sp. 4213-co]|uniref:Prefoldin subunit alpha n=1 Tax=Ignisphaera cupida TaxID=3050454 RepID=A0ABD4Z699_9CREN|nr:prefoldin subunit alpha [Ignisphaera sp. 4213-co]MDK6028527.1 prefoldin subunit alpha [Ignisphaera sp. 4213-co]